MSLEIDIEIAKTPGACEVWAEATGEEKLEIIKIIREAALKEAAKLVCPHCQANRGFVLGTPDRHIIGPGQSAQCIAAPLWPLIESEEK